MSERPNVVVFFTDQQRYDTSGLHGCPLDLTPNLDAAALRGTHLAQCITCQPVCAPARGCFQTGVYATEHGVWSNAQGLAPDTRGLAHTFADAGYETAYFGKWHLVGPKHGKEQSVDSRQRLGYKHWLGANILEFCSQPYQCNVYDGENRQLQLPGYRPDALVDASIRFINEHRDKPFFVFISVLEPHHQNEHYAYVAPRGYRERYAGRWLPPDLAQLPGNGPQHIGGYFGCVKRCDEAFGRLWDCLDSLNLTGKTNVLYTADHGCHFGTREGWDKRSCHESSVRVPGALFGPSFDGGGRIDQPVSLIDLPPTLLQSAGLEIPKHFRGQPIQRLSALPARQRPETEAFIQISESGIGRALRTNRWKYALTAPAEVNSTDGTAPRYFESHLYDLEYDPYELCNRIGDQELAAVQTDLRTRLLAQMKRIGEPVPEILPTPADLAKPRWKRY